MNTEPKISFSAADFLRRSAELIDERAAQRDRPGGEKSMAACVAAFNEIYADLIRANDGRLDEVMGWHFMELLKMVRSAYGVYVPDDYLDKISYAAIAAESAGAANNQIRTRQE